MHSMFDFDTAFRDVKELRIHGKCSDPNYLNVARQISQHMALANMAVNLKGLQVGPSADLHGANSSQ